MKISNQKLDIVLARRCINRSELRKGVSSQTLVRIKQGCDVTPKTAGYIARALGVDVTEIIKEEVG